MDINFELYKIFYIVARSGSFSAAARELFVTQSAVSQSIKALETQTGSTLFVRGTKNVKLTSVGEMLYSHVGQAYALLKTAEGKMLEMQSLGSGEIRIGVGDTILHHLLIPVLQEFINKYPNIKIQINNRTSPGIIDSLKSGTVDLGIVTLPVTDKSIETPEFREVEDVFVASSRFNHLKDRDVSIDELTSLPLLLLKRESSTRRNLDQYFSSKGFSIVPEIELESMELLVELSRIGLGIAHVLKESVEDAIKKGELFILNLADPIPPRKLGIAKLRNVPLSPSADIFASMLLN